MTRDRCTTLEEYVVSQELSGLDLYPVTDCLILAGQPQPKDWQKLVDQGVERVINIRGDEEHAAIEGNNARAAGLDYRWLQVPAYELEPQHIEEFDTIMQQCEGRKTLLHCRTGSRTALLWMLRRIAIDGWSWDRAEAELRDAGYGDDDMEVFDYCATDYFERADAEVDAAAEPAFAPLRA